MRNRLVKEIKLILADLAEVSENLIGSFILLLSGIPEFYSVYHTLINSNIFSEILGMFEMRLIAGVSACVSLISVKLALSRKTSLYQALYALQLTASAALIIFYGDLILGLALLCISAVGALCSNDIAQLLREEKSAANQMETVSKKMEIDLDYKKQMNDIKLKRERDKAMTDQNELTPRQLDIMGHLKTKTRQQIATELGISTKTVQREIQAIKDKGKTLP